MGARSGTATGAAILVAAVLLAGPAVGGAVGTTAAIGPTTTAGTTAAIGSTATAGPTAAAGTANVAGTGGSCQADGAKQLCLNGTSLGATTLSAGSSTELSLTVENVGDERATAVVVLNVAGPGNGTDSYELRRRSLAPGETLTVTQSVDASTPGTHAMQAIVYDDDLSHRYDASEPMTVTVERQGLGGGLDAPEYALAALVGSVAVVGGMVYRRR